MDQPPGVTVFKRAGGRIRMVRTVSLAGYPSGAALTHDEKTLIVTTDSNIAFLDVERLILNKRDPLSGYLNIHNPIDINQPVGTFYVNTLRSDQFAFVSAERAGFIAVVDIQKAQQTYDDTTAVVGVIPTGNAPIALVFSNDERYLYATSQIMSTAMNWPICKAVPWNYPQGAVFVIDVVAAQTNPEHSVINVIPAGCSPVRLVVSPDGNTAYVTARGENNLLVFDTRKFLMDIDHALIARVPVGIAPVGVAVFDKGKKIVVANSNRFSNTNVNQSLTVIDATRVSLGAEAVMGTIPTGVFPREISITSDGKTLFVTNFTSKTLEVVDLVKIINSMKRN